MKVRHLPSSLGFAVFLQIHSALKIALLLTALFCTVLMQAQTNVWSPVPLGKSPAKAELTPDLPNLEKGILLQLDVAAMQNLGLSAAKETNNTRYVTTIIDLPLPNGSFQKFKI